MVNPNYQLSIYLTCLKQTNYRAYNANFYGNNLLLYSINCVYDKYSLN